MFFSAPGSARFSTAFKPIDPHSQADLGLDTARDGFGNHVRCKPNNRDTHNLLTRPEREIGHHGQTEKG
jgi:hypothetical protein